MFRFVATMAIKLQKYYKNITNTYIFAFFNSDHDLLKVFNRYLW